MGLKPARFRKTRVLRWQQGSRAIAAADDVAAEEPLEVRVDTRPIVVTMRTPGHDDELAAGFLIGEGLIRSREEVLKISTSGRNDNGNVVDVFLASTVSIDFAKLNRNVYASSSCGICGKASIEAVHRHFPKIERGFTIPASALLGLPDQLRSGQETFARTGGIHAAAVFDGLGRLVVLREDVGRHNAVDKVLGHGFLNGLLPFDQHVLMVSGRVSFEILQKALAGRIAVVAAVSAPSSLAVDFARKSGQTLVGFLRGDRMNVYSHPRRLFPVAPAPAGKPTVKTHSGRKRPPDRAIRR
ncbi:MAG: FdhD protein [Verrucomicrobiota bacterium]|jgi:FdhD protein